VRRARPALLVWLLLAALSTALAARAVLAAPKGTLFVGTFYYVDDFYNYLGHVEQAQRGALVFKSKLAAPDAPPALVNLEWLVVGWLAAALGGDPLLAYRLFGLATLAVLVALAQRWLTRCGLPSERQLLALLLAFTGGGLGGLLYGLGWLPGQRALDLRTGAFPFVEALANPHFLAGSTLLLAGLAAFAAGRVWLGAALGSILGLVRPYDAALLALVEGLAILLSEPPRRWPRRLLPVATLVPVLAYSAWLVLAAPGFGAFSSPRYAAESATPLDLLIALGPAAALALTAARGWPARGLPGHGERLRLVLWAACAVGIVLLRPVSFSLQFLVGAGLPLLLLAALGLGVSAPRGLAAAVPLMATSACAAVWLCTLPGPRTHPPAERFRLALALRQVCRPGELVLAPRDVGLYVGGLSPCWPYVSHAAAPEYDERERAVQQFYDPLTPAAARGALLSRVCPAYVVLPPRLPAGWLADDGAYRPRLLAQGTAALAAWSRDPARPCPGRGPAVFR
jgi:hypothetical protein